MFTPIVSTRTVAVTAFTSAVLAIMGAVAVRTLVRRPIIAAGIGVLPSGSPRLRVTYDHTASAAYGLELL